MLSVECLVLKVQRLGLRVPPNRLRSDERRHGHRASRSIRRQLHLFQGLGLGLGFGFKVKDLGFRVEV